MTDLEENLLDAIECAKYSYIKQYLSVPPQNGERYYIANCDKYIALGLGSSEIAWVESRYSIRSIMRKFEAYLK